jgi:hypothetical protein
MTDGFNELKEQLEQLHEELFLCRQDTERYRTESIALKNFIQTLYENCEKVESDKDTELTLTDLLKNLKENIRVFARDHHIRL